MTYDILVIDDGPGDIIEPEQINDIDQPPIDFSKVSF